jgi:hypothetical protein
MPSLALKRQLHADVGGVRKRASVSAVLDQFFNTPVLSTNTSIVSGFLTRPSQGGCRSGLSAQCSPASVATQPQPPRAQPAHAVPLRPSLCAPSAGPAVRQALPATARQPPDADAPDVEQLLRCHAPSRLRATLARSRRCAAPYEMEKLAVALLVCPWNEQVTVAVPPVPDDSMCHVHPTTPLLPTVFQGLCRPALLPACSAPEPAVHGAAHAWIP